MTLHLFILFAVLTITSPSTTSAQANCSRVCGTGVGDRPVPYPFGFSDGCEIQLNCSDAGDIRVGDYIVKNITSDRILVNLPAKCDRKLDEIRVFNGANFALTSRNGLLLENCSLTLNDCVVSTSRVDSHFNIQKCDARDNSSTMNCFAEDNPYSQEFMNLKPLDAASCQILFSSVTPDANGSGSPTMPVSLEFQSLELGWWVRGECSCDRNASCQDVTYENRSVGYRCHCNDGYAGDGFAAGEGCRRVAAGGGKKPQYVIIVSALCVGGLTIAIIVILCLKGKISWRKKPKYNVNVENFLKNQEFLTPKRYSYSQIKKMTNSFEIKLGQGGFGCVYKGMLSNKFHVAVKVLSEVKGNGEDFINEVASVGRTSHVNIVTLVGFCLEGHRRALIYEFMPNGSLERFIYGHNSSSTNQLGWEKLHQIAIGIARGLEYLHKGCNTRILHLDIKPHNILLDQNLCPKISDFGLSKLFPDRTSMISMSRMRGTPGYIAPELFSRNFGQVSHKSDVYSYGMMVLEMVGGRKNFEVEVDHTSEIYFPHWIYKKLDVDEQLGLHGIVSDEENEIARKMIIVGLWCIQTNPLNRPTITKVLEMLEAGDLLSLEIPPKPYLSSPSRSVSSPSTYCTNV